MLAIYESLASAELSHDGTYSNPLKLFSPLAGSTQTMQLFIQSDSGSSENFYNIVVGVYDSLSPDESSWWQLAPDVAGSAGAFSTGRLALGTLLWGSSLPFWIQLAVPTQTTYGSTNRFSLYANYTTTP